MAVWLAADDEFGATAAVDPYAVVVPSPGLILDAGGTADLAGEADATACIDVAEIATAVVGGTGNDLASSPLTGASRIPIASAATADDEFSSAAAVDPHAAVVPSPGLVLDAGGAADLAGKADAATSVGAAEVASTVVGGAGDGLALTLAVNAKEREEQKKL